MESNGHLKGENGYVDNQHLNGDLDFAYDFVNGCEPERRNGSGRLFICILVILMSCNDLGIDSPHTEELDGDREADDVQVLSNGIQQIYIA